MRHFNRAVSVAAVLVAACAGPVTEVKLDTPAPSRSTSAPTSPSSPAPTVESTPGATGTATVTATARVVATETPNGPEPTGPPLLAWTERSDIAAGPSAREDQTWTVAGDSGIAYMLGGKTGAGPSSELWAFDLAADTWTALEPTTDGPPARFGHTATWVPDVGLVVWSGQGESGFFGDIWAYDPQANTWTELPSLGAVPEARYGSCASLGPDGELWISHGFTGEGRFDDTRSYEFDAGTWTDRTPVGDAPIKRCLHDCFWAPIGRLILYGGQTNGVQALGDIWAFDPEAGAWEQGIEQAAPPRQLYALASDPRFGNVVFGGGSIHGAFLDDTWALDWAGPQLHALEVAGRPSARSGAALIADADGRYLLFGGENENGLIGDLWELRAGT